LVGGVLLNTDFYPIWIRYYDRKNEEKKISQGKVGAVRVTFLTFLRKV